MAITIYNHTISSIVVSTFMGHSGDRIFDIPPEITDLLPSYRRLRQAIRETGTTVLTKSSTFERQVGSFRLYNPLTWRYIRPLEHDGMLNAYGLTNDGVEVNVIKIASAIRGGFEVIPNFYPQFSHGQTLAIDKTLRAIALYAGFLGSLFWALELNFSCPNAKKEICRNMENALACAAAIKSRYPWLCLIGKISIVHPNEFAQELVNAGVDIIHAVNTIPYDLVYLDGPPSPLQAVGGGGVSGGPAFKQAFEYNEGLRELISVPIIMGCGVTSASRAQKYFDINADAVSLCTVCRLNPREAVRIIKVYSW